MSAVITCDRCGVRFKCETWEAHTVGMVATSRDRMCGHEWPLFSPVDLCKDCRYGLEKAAYAYIFELTEGPPDP